MCEVCGCDDGATATAVNLQTGRVTPITGGQTGPEHPAHGHMHSHGHAHLHEHVHADGTRHVHAFDDPHHRHHGETASQAGQTTMVEIGTRVLAKNDELARQNRTWLAKRHVLAINLMGAPGAGKTALLERTIRDIGTTSTLSVLEGDQATLNDSERIRAAGANAVQVNTGTGCHLDAEMVARGLAELNPCDSGIVVVENVGNLVCPALFDLGERRRVVVFSVTEGEDKPIKYPHMFRAADLVLLSKVDLLPHIEFDVARAVANARSVNPDVAILHVSTRSGEGVGAWYEWLRREQRELGATAFA